MGTQQTPSRRTSTSRTSTPRAQKASRRLLKTTSCNAVFAWAVLLTALLALYVASLKSAHLASLRHVIVKAVTGSVDDAFFTRTDLMDTSLADVDGEVEESGAQPMGLEEAETRMVTKGAVDAHAPSDNAGGRVREQELFAPMEQSVKVNDSQGRRGDKKGRTGHSGKDRGHRSKDSSGGQHNKSFPISVPAGERWRPPAGRRCANVEEMGEAATGNTAAASLKIRRAIKEHFAVLGEGERERGNRSPW